MRLDFSWNEALSESLKSEIEEVANLAIRQDLSVRADLMDVEAAKKSGAIALFGETYDELVRVVQIGGPWSRELCGGTHVSRSSQVGMISLMSESSVGSGTRRVEALVGIEAFRSFAAERRLIQELTDMLKVAPDELTERVLKTVTELKQAQKKISHLSIETLRKSIPNLVRDAKQISGTKFVYANFGSDTDSEGLRELASSIASGLESVSAVVVTASVVDGKVALMVATTSLARQEGHSSGRLVKVASVILGAETTNPSRTIAT
jgi:alanyl-tRNA synthetase